MDDSHTIIFRFCGTSNSAWAAVGGDWWDEIAPYPDDDYGDAWGFDEIFGHFQVFDFCANLR